MSRIEALITPSVMQWAREQAKLSLEEAAQKIKRPVEDLQGWEDGSIRPSLAQARKASKVYKRPLAVFYLPEPPITFETLRDFRRLPDRESRDYSPELALLIREARYRQAWTREFLIDEGIEPLPFVGSATLADSPRDIALQIHHHLQITPDEQRKCATRQEALRLWLEKTESAGIFVFRQRQVALSEARGFLISDDIAPFIFINSGDSKAAQIFTLAHELAHLWLNLSGVSNLEPIGETVDYKSVEVEVFCNKVAAEAILEEETFNSEWSKQSPHLTLEEKINHVSSTLKVSEEVVARRLLEKGIISQELYLELRQVYQERWIEVKSRERERMKSSKGGPSYYVTTVAANGYAFTQTVVGAFMAGDISGRDASSLLNVKVNNLYRLGKTAGVPVYHGEADHG